jgi:hypothetical protein
MDRTPNLKPCIDLDADIARMTFEGLSPQQIVARWRKAMTRDPEMFQVLADRAFGKLKTPIEICGPSRRPLPREWRRRP